mgnify:CR=1 FL=1
MKPGFESSDNFANVLEYMNSCQHSSSESINELEYNEPELGLELELELEPESRSNSVTSDDIDNRRATELIPIPLPNATRKRETMCNGLSALDLHNLTPTPTKHKKILEENMNNIGSLINLYYEGIEHKMSPYSK